jgi:type IV fimbrial biogenesis protein FimT
VPSVAISGASQRIIFRPDGLARTTTTSNALLAAQLRACIVTTSPLINSRGVAIASGSRTTIFKTTDATCTATGN